MKMPRIRAITKDGKKIVINADNFKKFEKEWGLTIEGQEPKKSIPKKAVKKVAKKIDKVDKDKD